MATIEDIKGAVLDTIGSVAGKARDLAGTVADRTKDVSRIAKLNMEIAGERDTIKKAYAEIGKLYYEIHRDTPDSVLVQLCDEVRMAEESIAAKEAEIEELKAANARTEEADDVVVEFENIVADAEAAVEEAVEEVVETVEEATEQPEE